MALRSTVLNADNTLCELWTNTCSDISENSENEILESDSDVATTSLCKQLWPSAIVFSSDSEKSTQEEGSKDPEGFGDKTSNW